ncbi:MAG: response regulator [Hyphomonadaceae bacterium]
MSPKTRVIQFLVCDENSFTRKLVADVLAGAGFEKVQIANDGMELLSLTAEFLPRVVITSSRIPGISGLEYTRMIRGGYGVVNRATSIIVMTDTPTQKFLDAARMAGVDEMLVRPFNGAALLARVEAVLLRPRRFVESVSYVGPCRRRRMLDEYGGPLRRFTDPLEDSDKPLWEAESNRALVRQAISKISEISRDLAPTDRRKLREVYAAVKDTEQLADDVRDQFMGDAARSLGRYITAIGGSGGVEHDVLSTHIDALQKLCVLGSDHQEAREELVKGLVAVVDKRLGRKASAPNGAPPPSRAA